MEFASARANCYSIGTASFVTGSLHRRKWRAPGVTADPAHSSYISPKLSFVRSPGGQSDGRLCKTAEIETSKFVITSQRFSSCRASCRPPEWKSMFVFADILRLQLLKRRRMTQC